MNNTIRNYIDMVLQTCVVTSCNMYTDPSTGEIKKVVVEFLPKRNDDTEKPNFGKLGITDALFRKNGGK